MFVNQIAKVISKFSEEFQIYLIAIFCIVFAKALVSFIICSLSVVFVVYFHMFIFSRKTKPILTPVGTKHLGMKRSEWLEATHLLERSKIALRTYENHYLKIQIRWVGVVMSCSEIIVYSILVLVYSSELNLKMRLTQQSVSAPKDIVMHFRNGSMLS